MAKVTIKLVGNKASIKPPKLALAGADSDAATGALGVTRTYKAKKARVMISDLGKGGGPQGNIKSQYGPLYGTAKKK